MLTESPAAVLDRVPGDDGEQTTQLHLTPWQWPLVDPDVLDEAHAVLHCPDEPTLPILEAVLAGLRSLAT